MELQLKDFAPVFSSVVWAILAFAVFVLLKREIKRLVEKIACANDLTIKVGQLTMQAKAFQEMKGSVETVFNGELLNKDELNAFFDIKLKSVFSEIHRATTGNDPRTESRMPISKTIKIKTEEGNVFDGETLDISSSGISFKTKGRLGIFETVVIEPVHTETCAVSNLLDRAKIVRIELSKGCYHYGATAPTAACN